MTKAVVQRELFAWWSLFFLALLAVALGAWGSHLYLLAQAKPVSLADSIYRAIQLFGFNLYDPGPMPWQLETARWMAPMLTLTSLLTAFAGVLRGHFLNLRISRLRNHTVLVGKYWSTEIRTEGDVPSVFVQIDGDTQPRTTVNGNISLQASDIYQAVSRCAMHTSSLALIEVNSISEGVSWIAALQNASQEKNRVSQDVCLVSDSLSNTSGLKSLSHLAEPILRVRVIDLTQMLFERCTAWVAEAIARRSDLRSTVLLRLAGDADYSLEIARQLAMKMTVLPGSGLEVEICSPASAPLAQNSLQALSNDAPHISFRQSALDLENVAAWESAGLDLVCYCSKNPDDLLFNFASLTRILQTNDAPLLAVAIHSSWSASEAITSLLGRSAHPKLALICGGMPQEIVTSVHACSASEQLARQIHASYLTTTQDPGAPANKPWDSLAERYRESSRLQVQSFMFKLACLGYSLDTAMANIEVLQAQIGSEIELLAEAEHNRWAAEKKLQGWTYGSCRDDSAKTHPSLTPYANLAESEKEKDRVMWCQLITFVQDAKQRTLPL